MSDRITAEATDEVDVLLRVERRRQGRERFGVMAIVTGILTGGVTLTLSKVGSISDGGASVGFAIAAALGLLGAAAALLWRRGRAARRLEGLIGRRDRLQRVRNDRIYAGSITGWGLVAVGLSPLWRIVQGQADGDDFGIAAATALSPLFVMMSVAGWEGVVQLNRRWLEDEVTRDIRRRALSLGFIVLMTAMTALFVIALWERDWVVMGFPATLMLAASVAGLRFVWLDQQAEGGDGG